MACKIYFSLYYKKLDCNLYTSLIFNNPLKACFSNKKYPITI